MTDPIAAVATSRLGKRYRKNWAVQDCTLSVPKGRIAALIGPNGAGKSTLLRMLAGITEPSVGEVRIAGRMPRDAESLSRIGYLDQERPLYKDFRVEEMLHFGRACNPRWDDAAARRHLDAFGISVASRIAKLSGGQQAQVAFTTCLAKRPDLLLLDEPVAALDPVARGDVMHLLLNTVVDNDMTVLLSSHAVSDLASVCDYVIILSESRVLVADELDQLLDHHRLLVGASEVRSASPGGSTVVASTSTRRQTNLLVRVEQHPFAAAGWSVQEPTLEEIAIAYIQPQPRPPIDLGISPRSSSRDTDQGLTPR